MTQPFETRLAVSADQSGIARLMDLSTRQLQEPFLDRRQIEASFELMGLDVQLVEDGTYYLAHDGRDLVGCGGWSRRATLFGGSHSAGRDAALLDPARDAARIRAMYTHPAHARRGVGRLILRTCEAAARAEGFRRVELAATLAGEPLYRACGYHLIEKMHEETSSGIAIPALRMGRDL